MRILFVKTSSLGDIAQSVPAADWIKRHIPEAIIHWVVEKPFEQVLEPFQAIDKTLVADTKNWRKKPFTKSTIEEIKAFLTQLRETSYDVLFDLQGNTKSAFITAFAKANDKVGFGWKTAPELSNPFFTSIRFNPAKELSAKKRYLYVVGSYFGADSLFIPKTSLSLSSPPFTPEGSPSILLFPSSAWSNKTLSTKQLQALFEKIKENHPKMKCTLFWGNEKERQWCEEIAQNSSYCLVASKRYSPKELLSLMEKSDYVFAADSFALHLASHTNTSIVSFFGPSNGKLYAPEGEKSAYFQGSCPYGVVFEKRCPHVRTCKTGNCLKQAPTEDLFEAFIQIGKRSS
jgi:heptosyltransferase-1